MKPFMMLLASAAMLTSMAAAPAFAQSTKDAVMDKDKDPVLDSWGKCVRTKWDNPNDPCAAKAAEMPAETAPAAAPAQMEALNKLGRDDRSIYFDFDKSALKPEAAATLDKLLGLIGDGKGVIHAKIIGYADEIGTSRYNMKLSETRAAAVRNYLRSKGYTNTEVTEVRGLGELASGPECQGLKRAAKIECMWKDRRVELEFEYQAAAK